MMRRAAVVIALAATGIGAGALLGQLGAPMPPQCARQPSDGGICLRVLPDGGAIRHGEHTVFGAGQSRGQCHVFDCPKEP